MTTREELLAEIAGFESRVLELQQQRARLVDYKQRLLARRAPLLCVSPDDQIATIDAHLEQLAAILEDLRSTAA